MGILRMPQSCIHTPNRVKYTLHTIYCFILYTIHVYILYMYIYYTTGCLLSADQPNDLSVLR